MVCAYPTATSDIGYKVANGLFQLLKVQVAAAIIALLIEIGSNSAVEFRLLGVKWSKVQILSPPTTCPVFPTKPPCLQSSDGVGLNESADS